MNSNANESERGDGNLPSKKPMDPSEAQEGVSTVATPRPQPMDIESESDSDSSVLLGSDLRNAEERACDFSEEEPSTNTSAAAAVPEVDKPSSTIPAVARVPVVDTRSSNVSPTVDADPRVGSVSLGNHRVLYSTMWSKDRVKAARKNMRKASRMKAKKCLVDGVATAVAQVHLDDTQQSSSTAGTSTQVGSGLNTSSSVPLSGDTGAPVSIRTVEPMDTDGSSNGANMANPSARKARMAVLRTELHSLEALDKEEDAKVDAEKKAAKAVQYRQQMALSDKRKSEGLAASGPYVGSDQSWPNYNRKDKLMPILRGQSIDFLSEMGVPVEMASMCSWGTLSNVYGSLMIGLYGAGVLPGIDERLDRGFFTLSKSMLQVMDYVSWQVPAMVDRLREEMGKGYKTLLGGKYLSSVTLVTSPTAQTPGPLIPTSGKKRRSKLKPSALKASHRRDNRKAPSSGGNKTSTSSNPTRIEPVVPPVEPAVGTIEPTESAVPVVDRPCVDLSEATEKPGESLSYSRAVEAGASYSSSDLRADELRIAREAEREKIVGNWISTMTEIGMSGASRIDFTILRLSLREKLRKAGCDPLRSGQEWAYARRVMDSVLPAQRRTGHYKQIPKKQNSGRQARQSTAKPAQASKAAAFKKGKQKKKVQNIASFKSSTSPSSHPAVSQRALEDQEGYSLQGRPRNWTRGPYKRGAPSPHKGSSSSQRKK